MGHWNHRVVKATYPNGEEYYSIREVFYNKDGEIYAYTTEPVDIAGESVEEVKEYLQWCLDCIDKPMLEDGKVDFANSDLDE